MHTKTNLYRCKRLQAQRKQFAHRDHIAALYAFHEHNHYAPKLVVRVVPATVVHRTRQLVAAINHLVAESAGQKHLCDHAAQHKNYVAVGEKIFTG